MLLERDGALYLIDPAGRRALRTRSVRLRDARLHWQPLTSRRNLALGYRGGEVAVHRGLELAGGARDGRRRKQLPADGKALCLQLVPHAFSVGIGARAHANTARQAT
mgnify:CR=1 FL=1